MMDYPLLAPREDAGKALSAVDLQSMPDMVICLVNNKIVG